MAENTGLNTKGQTGKGTTATSDLEKENENGRSTIQGATASARINTNSESNPRAESPPWPLLFIHPDGLPYEVKDAIRKPLNLAHFALTIPNESAAIVTRESIADIPSGYIVVLVFPDQPLHDPAHMPGQPYIINPTSSK